MSKSVMRTLTLVGLIVPALAGVSLAQPFCPGNAPFGDDPDITLFGDPGCNPVNDFPALPCPNGNILELVTDVTCVRPGDCFTVELRQCDLRQLVTGFQTYVGFDENCLAFNGITFPTDPYRIGFLGPRTNVSIGFLELVTTIDESTQSPTRDCAVVAIMEFCAIQECDNPLASVFHDPFNSPPPLFSGTTPGEGIPPCRIPLALEICIDDTEPTITCPPDVTIDCDDSTSPTNTGFAQATDNCDAVQAPTLSFSDTFFQGNCPDEGVIERRWCATDCVDLTSCCEQIITIEDITPPVISCPSNITIECDESTDPTNTGMAFATDNCDPNPIVTFSDSVNWPAPPCPDRTMTRVWTATDRCGNSSSCTQTITVEDSVPPVITCPADTTVDCSAGTPDPANTGMATASDNCDSSPDITFSDSMSGTCPRIITRRWCATDDCGNTSCCSQTITLEDNTAPIITCPPDISISCEEDPFDTSITGVAEAFDTCDPFLVVTWTDIFVDLSGCNGTGTIIRRWCATDFCDNTACCEQTITVVDVTRPVITCPPDITIDCDDSASPTNTGFAIATDNCTTNPIITFSDSSVPGNCPQERTITRTWRATDDCGNFRICVQMITVEDNTPPQISCPGDITINCEDSTDPSNTGSAFAFDLCDQNPTVSFSDTVNTGVCPILITRHWCATDACDNTACCDQIITVVDNEPPVITCPPDITIECDESTDPSNTGMATASDNCTDPVTITYSDSFVCPGPPAAPGCPQDDFICRLWTATDECGLTATCIQRIVIKDRTAPTITCPPDVTIECDEDTSPANTGSASAEDNCDPNPLVTWSDSIQQGDCADEWVITRDWWATDACGNSSHCTQTITVEDNTPPAITCPQDLTIDCNDDSSPANTGSATAVDNCDQDPTITWSDEISSECPVLIMRTWTAEDNCGNASSCLQVITQVDEDPPVFADCDGTLPDIRVVPDAGRCDADVEICIPVVEENCDGCEPGILGLLSTGVILDFNGQQCKTFTFPPGVTQITWIAKDCCGLVAGCSQHVIVEDYNILRAVIDIGPGVLQDNLTRCTTFGLWNECTSFDPIEEEVTYFQNNDLSNADPNFWIFRSTGTVDIQVPCGVYTCMSAQDRLHTLRSVDQLSIIDDGGQLIYLAEYIGPRCPQTSPVNNAVCPANYGFDPNLNPVPTGQGHWLVPGNLDSGLPPTAGSDPDVFIDIRDWAVIQAQSGTNFGTGDTTCPSPDPADATNRNGDINGDGFVNLPTADFSIWRANLFFKREDGCCEGFSPLQSGPVTSVTVGELMNAGYPRIWRADINADGVIDMQDVDLYQSGYEGSQDPAPTKPKFKKAGNVSQAIGH